MLSGNTRTITLIVMTVAWDVFILLVILSTTYLPRPYLEHIRTRCVFVDNFEFAINKAFDVCIGIPILF